MIKSTINIKVSVDEKITFSQFQRIHTSLEAEINRFLLSLIINNQVMQDKGEPCSLVTHAVIPSFPSVGNLGSPTV